MSFQSSFPLFRSHLDLAHAYWEKIVQPGDLVIDATCGNGHDSLVLAKLALSLIAIDLQPRAIQTTRQLIESQLPHIKDKIQYFTQCHSIFPSSIASETVKLIVYNLGYLPGGDKTLTTLSSSTQQSLITALPLICAGGALSITCYPGHAAGILEMQKVHSFAEALDPTEWSCCHHRWLNRQKAPELLFIQRKTKAIT